MKSFSMGNRVAGKEGGVSAGRWQSWLRAAGRAAHPDERQDDAPCAQAVLGDGLAVDVPPEHLRYALALGVAPRATGTAQPTQLVKWHLQGGAQRGAPPLASGSVGRVERVAAKAADAALEKKLLGEQELEAHRRQPQPRDMRQRDAHYSTGSLGTPRTLMYYNLYKYITLQEELRASAQSIIQSSAVAVVEMSN